MRALVLGLMAIVAVTGGAAARDCAGQGSEQLLRVDDWAFSSSGKSQVDLSYRLDDEKAATLVQGHVYFQLAPDDVLADAAIDLTNAAGVSVSGVGPVTVSKAAASRLAEADHEAVNVFACINYVEYLDGSGMIID